MSEPPGYQPPGDPTQGCQPPTYQPPAYQPPGNQPPSYQPPAYQPPAGQPGNQRPLGYGSSIVFDDGPVVRRRRAWPALLGLVVVAVGVFVALQLRSGGGNGYPKHWDPRVQAAVDFVERDRGLTFKHPVKVEFLDAATFTARVTGGSSGDDGKEATALDQTAAELKATGLVPNSLDLRHALKTLRGSTVLGYYEFSSRHIVVRGSSLSPAATVTVVHELTHALQDQYYDIGRKGAEIARTQSSTERAGLDDGFHAVVEGDARRVENDYVRSLSPNDRAAVTREEDGERTAAKAAIKDVPQVLLAVEEVPYDLGRSLVEYQRQAAGAQSESTLFQRWPSSDMEILQPWRYVDGNTAARVPFPSLPHGRRAFDRGTLGSVDWYFTLAERLGPARALAAADGWAGDSFVAYRDGARPCLRATLRATSASALAAMHTGFSAWARAVPALDPRVSTRSGDLSVQTCAPAAGAHLAVPNRTGAALVYATNRSDLATALLRTGATPTAAPCIATRLLRRIPVAVIVSGKSTPRTQRIVRQARAACG